MSKSALSPQELAHTLLGEKHTEQEVTQMIHDIDNYPDVEWVPLGRERNNYSIVENQQAEPMAAFTELVINSIDAIILRSYFDRFGDDYTGNEFSSLEEAANELID